MVDFFYSIYSLFCNDNSFLERTKINSVFRHLIKEISNIIIPLYFSVSAKSNHKIERKAEKNPRLIVSLTSFPARINNLWIGIESLLRQQLKPDALYLWLSKEQFPNLDSVPKRLRKMQSRGLNIILCDGDLRSHKKYYYALKNFPNDHLFTVDDDIIYPSNTLSSVIEVSRHFPKCVLGRFSNRIIKDENGDVVFNRQPHKNFVIEPLETTFLGSGGGTLFPAGSLPEIALNKDVFMSICKTADDVWLNSMTRFAGFRSVSIMNKCPLLEIKNRKNITLFEFNSGVQNHIQQRAVRNYCISHGRDPFENL